MSNLVELVFPTPAKDFEAEAQRALVQAEHYAIADDDMYAAAAEDLRAIKTRYKEIEEQRRTITAPLDQAKRATMDFFRPALDFLQRAEATLKRSMVIYDQARRAQAEEAERLAREAARREQERLEKLADKAEAKGKSERADELREQAAMVPASVLAPPPPPKAAGIARTSTWDFRIVDETKLPREYLVPDAGKIRGVVRSMKGQTRIDGVEVFEVQGIAASRT